MPIIKNEQNAHQLPVAGLLAGNSTVCQITLLSAQSQKG